eukprot:CAMPEP_0115505800 /NCGR_PEP_ID=MMETSP0271-20121206/70791_1 /TAXON_ID=71861 /ORGANISM="Scrippsiella trochoidea, Strain CCMP3099" /LENGTH=84 /DNA_ID=CAMNT_0002935159 /DNA_START=75 /DNA_END=326 /DNA_ORIENTATION=+
MAFSDLQYQAAPAAIACVARPGWAQPKALARGRHAGPRERAWSGATITRRSGLRVAAWAGSLSERSFEHSRIGTVAWKPAWRQG